MAGDQKVTAVHQSQRSVNHTDDIKKVLNGTNFNKQ